MDCKYKANDRINNNKEKLQKYNISENIEKINKYRFHNL